MDAVKATIESLGGQIEIATAPGRGTTTALVVPITAAVQRVLLVDACAQAVALPIAKIERLLEVEPGDIEEAGRESFLLVDDEPMLVLDLGECVGWGPTSSARGTVPLVLVEMRGQRVALRVERLGGQQEIYVKPLPPLFAGLRTLAGLTVLGDGSPVFLLDVGQLA
jgi:chemotaxis protein histidine kinase CheA